MTKASEWIDRNRQIARRNPSAHRSAVVYQVAGLADLLGEVSKLTTESADHLRTYIPIALITRIEVFFRLAVTEIIDRGEPYAGRAASILNNLKFDLPAIRALEGQSITLGQLAGTVQSFHSVEAIFSTMNALLADDFKKRLTTTINRWDVEVMGLPNAPVIRDIDKVVSLLQRVLEVRHIVVHELPRKTPFSRDEQVAWIAAVIGFLEASDWLINEELDPAAPLQQQPMNAAEIAKFEEADRKLQLLISEYRGRLAEYRKQDFDSAQRAWEQHRESIATFEGNEFEEGTLQPFIYAQSKTRLTEDRIKAIKKSIELDDLFEDRWSGE